MDGSNDRRRVLRAPGRRRQPVRLGGVLGEEVSDGTRVLRESDGDREEIHLVIRVPDLIRLAARPGLDLVEPLLILIVARLADEDLLVAREGPRPALSEARDVHHEAAVFDLVDGVVPVLAGLDDLVLEEALLDVVHGLLGSEEPAGVEPVGAVSVLPCAVDLRGDGLLGVVLVADEDPVACWDVVSVR